MRDLMELHGEAEPAWPHAVHDRVGVSSRWRVATAAAAVVVGAGLSLLLWQSDRIARPGSSAVRGAAPAPAALEPADGAMLPAAPTKLAWPADEAATAYKVALLDSESTPIWNSPRLHEPRLELPDEVRARLGPGRLYYWRVTIETGIERRQSPLHRFSLVP
jgi:hypothetical protein